jgi:Fe-S cluster assembly iron-binding protein IscA
MEKNIDNNEKELKNLNINYNTINNNTINNITNITVNIVNPIPFDQNWDLSSIKESDKLHLMLSKLMYTHLLEEILKNNINLNVIIDKNKEYGIVYKNNFEKYIKMEITDIVKNSMDKLHKNLLDINEDLKNNIFLDKYMLDYKNKDINKKYDFYNTDENTQNIVNKFISDIFYSKNDDSVQIMKDFLSNEEIINESLLGY